MRAYLAAASLVPLLVTAACTRSAAVAATDTTKPVTAGAAATATDTAAARKAIADADAQWAKADERGDANAVASNYASDAITAYEGEPTQRGHDAIARAIADRFAKTTLSNVSFRTDDLMIHGDMAVELGTATVTTTPKSGGKATVHTTRYMTVWQKQPDGSWKVVRDADVAPENAPRPAQ